MSRDIYITCGDADVASNAGTEKNYKMDKDYGQIEEYFHVATR